MGAWVKVGILVLAVLLLCVPMMVACGGGGNGGTAPPTGTTPPGPTKTEKKVITIGNHTDLTGVAAIAMETVNLGLDDIVRYYNENNLIPGIEVEVVKYDGQADPSKNVPGWEWLKERGADAVMVWFPFVAMALQPMAEKDRIPLFVAQAPRESLETPGYMFVTSLGLEDMAWNLSEWIMENEWDWQTKGPAKFGGAVGDTDGLEPAMRTLEKYAEMYPERMTWVGGYVLPTSGFQWRTAVEALKDCDYILPGNLFPFFLKDYVAAGYSKAKLIGTDSHMGWYALVEDMKLWPHIDGMVLVCQSEWWGEDGEYVRLSERLMSEYHPNSVDEIKQAGHSYNSLGNGMMLLEGIRNAAAAVGPENVDLQAIYEGLQSVKIVFDGVQRFSFTETKRTVVDRVAIYKTDSTLKTNVRASDWFPVLTAP
ncbi:MAG: ABC transporter substrate-binding protein [Chloroflexi bacterium]|nr:ABC transporter substrate-binding protein [Chloroflexota bacterium]